MKKILRAGLHKLILLTGAQDKILGVLFNNDAIRMLVRTLLEENSYLKRVGWLRAAQEKASVDAAGEAIPWLTYPFVHFLSDRLKPSFKLFEFGCGASTHYFAKRVASVEAIEHNPDWLPTLTDEEKEKVHIHLISLKEPSRYTNILETLGKTYQVIVVDGRHRVACMRAAVNYLSTDGVLILDNAERAWYAPGLQLMQEKGFRKLNFYGMAGMAVTGCCTTIFYREGNCMDI